MKIVIKSLVISFMTLLIMGNGQCQHLAKDAVIPDGSQLEARQIQSRSFETNDKKKTLKAIIATLQDLSFVIDKADQEVGSVTATKLDGYAIVMTVTVRDKGKKKMVVRANAQYNITPVKDPEFYQNFFTALSKSMFLDAQNIK